MFFLPMYTQTRFSSLSWKGAAAMKTFTLKILHALATVVAALLLYGVIVVLQMPKHQPTAATGEAAAPHTATIPAVRAVRTASAQR